MHVQYASNVLSVYGVRRVWSVECRMWRVACGVWSVAHRMEVGEPHVV